MHKNKYIFVNWYKLWDEQATMLSRKLYKLLLKSDLGRDVPICFADFTCQFIWVLRVSESEEFANFVSADYFILFRFGD